MNGLYVPILRAKHGELEALGHLSPRATMLISPMLEISPRDNETLKSVHERLADIAHRVAEGWGSSNAIYIDTPRIPPQDTAEALAFIFKVSRQLSLKTVPVTGPETDRGPGTSYLDVVAHIVERDKRGLAIRLTHDTVADSFKIDDAIESVLSVVKADIRHVDVLLDLESLPLLSQDKSGLDAIVDTVTDALRVLQKRAFRNVIIAASSIPEKVAKTVGGEPVRVPRIELQLLEHVAAQKSLRAVSFTDYCITYSRETDSSGPVRVPSRIRLSTPSHHLLFKGAPDGYRDICTDLQKCPELEHVSPSWGVREILDFASGNAGQGNATTWVARDTNSHIETTVSAVEATWKKYGRSLPQQAAEPRPWLQNILPY